MAGTKVLYLSEDYSTSKVHHNLCQNVAKKGCQIVLFSIHREKYYTDLTSSFGQIDYDWYIDQFSGNKQLYKYLFLYKIHYKYRKLATEVNLNDVALCHAATLFSDGAIALKLKKERGIPYVVSVRGTDTDLYSKWMFHLWSMGREILREAERVVFISPTLREALFRSKPFKSMRDEIMPKTIIIPNGIDDIWLQHIRTERQTIDKDNPRIIYIGVLDHNKNVMSLMDAVDRLSGNYPGIKLSIVGGNGAQEERIRNRCTEHPERYQMLGKIYDKDKLREEMRENDVFAMVSHGETFGLVYVEALSQGLPILFSQGRGIDGFFEERVGEAVNPDDVGSISRGLEQIICNNTEYVALGKKLNQFAWPSLASRYAEMYEQFK